MAKTIKLANGGTMEQTKYEFGHKVNTIGIDDYSKMENPNDIEEATIEPTHVMDNIIAKNDKFETINVLLIILCKELGISTESQPKEVLMAIGKVYEEYYKAMDDFRKLKNGNQGRDGKNISKDHENGQK